MYLLHSEIMLLFEETSYSFNITIVYTNVGLILFCPWQLKTSYIPDDQNN